MIKWFAMIIRSMNVAAWYLPWNTWLGRTSYYQSTTFKMCMKCYNAEWPQIMLHVSLKLPVDVRMNWRPGEQKGVASGQICKTALVRSGSLGGSMSCVSGEPSQPCHDGCGGRKPNKTLPLPPYDAVMAVINMVEMHNTNHFVGAMKNKLMKIHNTNYVLGVI